MLSQRNLNTMPTIGKLKFRHLEYLIVYNDINKYYIYSLGLEIGKNSEDRLS